MRQKLGELLRFEKLVETILLLSNSFYLRVVRRTTVRLLKYDCKTRHEDNGRNEVARDDNKNDGGGGGGGGGACSC